MLAGRASQEPGNRTGLGAPRKQGGNIMHKKLLAMSLGLILSGSAVLAQAEPPVTQEPPAVETAEFESNLMAALRAQPQFSEFVRLLETAGLMATLNDGRSFTIFAPTNEALALVEEELNELMDRPDYL